MTDKRCGTCEHCTMIHDRYAVASCVCNITCMIDSGGYNCLRSVCSTTKPCGEYSERTDSVEQVAIDAVKLIFDPPNYSRYKLMREAAEGYSERLRALGVDV